VGRDVSGSLFLCCYLVAGRVSVLCEFGGGFGLHKVHNLGRKKDTVLTQSMWYNRSNCGLLYTFFGSQECSIVLIYYVNNDIVLRISLFMNIQSPQ